MENRGLDGEVTIYIVHRIPRYNLHTKGTTAPWIPYVVYLKLDTSLVGSGKNLTKRHARVSRGYHGPGS